MLSFCSGGMFVSANLWQVGASAKFNIGEAISRGAAKFLANLIPNYIFDQF